MKNITDETFENMVVQSPVPVVLDIYADWCGPCKQLSPLLEELSKELENTVRFYKVNVDNDDTRKVVSLFGVRGIPTVVVFKGGVAVTKWSGLIPKTHILEKLNKVLMPS